MSRSAASCHASRQLIPSILVLLISLPAAAMPGPGADYLGTLEQALGVMEKGNARDALPALLAAQTMDGGDPLAPTALGLAFLRVGDINAAIRAFSQATVLSREGFPARDAASTAYLGLGIALLAANRPAEALQALGKAGQDPAAHACRAYAQALLGNRRPAADLAHATGDDGFALAVAGAGLEAAGNHRGAVALLAQAPLGRLRDGFDPPVDGRVLPRLGSANELAGSPIGAVGLLTKGQDVLTIEAQAPERAQYGSLLVDGEIRAVTNSKPFIFTWQAGKAAPGRHTLAVRTFGANNDINGQGVIALQVGPPMVPVPYDAARYRRALGRLAQMTKPRASPAFVHYHLARCLSALGRTREATTHLEQAVAIYPQYLDARARLLAAYRQSKASRVPLELKQAAPVRRGRPRIALTFDDGPHPKVTPQILALLARYHAKGTFFMVGTQVATFPDTAKAIARGGHELANHTFSHPNLEGLGPLGVQQELLRARVAIRNVTGRETHFFRPPGGRYNGEVRRAIADLGYRTVLWSSNILTHKPREPRAIAQAMLAEIKDGAVVLLHNGDDYTVDVLPLLLPELARRGYRFVTLSELLAR